MIKKLRKGDIKRILEIRMNFNPGNVKFEYMDH